MTPLAVIVMAFYYTLSTLFPIVLYVAIWRHMPKE